jgi:hypothetical protein
MPFYLKLDKKNPLDLTLKIKLNNKKPFLGWASLGN